MDTTNLIFLKLGGSLITDKNQPFTPRRDVLARLSAEIQVARAAKPDLMLLIGHGSGSFGHTAAKKHGTRQGVQTREQWSGFAEVWKEARALNEMVMAAFLQAGLPAIAFPPSAAVTARDGQVERWALSPLQSALQVGLIPVINGDTIFDSVRGGTILSTEDLFFYLARHLQPARILLAGIEPGVWADYPACTRLLEEITPASFASASHAIRGSASVDVTGGMLQKVESMLSLTESLPGFSAQIFSGTEPGLLQSVLLGSQPGTVIRLANSSI